MRMRTNVDKMIEFESDIVILAFDKSWQPVDTNLSFDVCKSGFLNPRWNNWIFCSEHRLTYLNRIKCIEIVQELATFIVYLLLNFSINFNCGFRGHHTQREEENKPLLSLIDFSVKLEYLSNVDRFSGEQKFLFLLDQSMKIRIDFQF